MVGLNQQILITIANYSIIYAAAVGDMFLTTKINDYSSLILSKVLYFSEMVCNFLSNTQLTDYGLKAIFSAKRCSILGDNNKLVAQAY